MTVVKVGREHTEKGERMSIHNSPIARAVGDVVRDDMAVEVGDDKFFLIEPCGAWHSYPMSAEVRKLHEAWNYRGEHYEATLTVNIHPLFLRRKAEITG